MEINKTSVSKYLCVTLDEELKWREYTKVVYKNLIKLVEIFCKLQGRLNSPESQTIY